MTITKVPVFVYGLRRIYKSNLCFVVFALCAILCPLARHAGCSPVGTQILELLYKQINPYWWVFP